MRRILVAVLSSIAMVALSAVPGAANTQVSHEAAGVFTGNAQLGGGLYSPVSNDPACTGSALPPVCPGGAANWSFNGNGHGIHYQPNTGGGPYGGVGPLTVAVGGQPTAIVSYGTNGYGAWCGYSGGTGGEGNLYLDEAVRAVNPLPAGLNVSTQDIHVRAVGWHQSAGTLIPFHGIVDLANTDTFGSRTPATVAAHGTIDGVVSAIPTPGAGSCLNGTAANFTIVGAAVASWHDGDQVDPH